MSDTSPERPAASDPSPSEQPAPTAPESSSGTGGSAAPAAAPEAVTQSDTAPTAAPAAETQGETPPPSPIAPTPAQPGFGEASHQWGGRAPWRGHRPRWSTRKTLAAAAIGLALVIGGGAITWAATGGGGHHHRFDRGPGHFREHLGMRNPGGMRIVVPGGGLHSETVVATGNGQYETRLTQTGQVTDASDSSITVKSADGYTQTYAIGSNTLARNGSVDKGSTVSVVAVKSADTATAQRIVVHADSQDAPQGNPVPQGVPMAQALPAEPQEEQE